MHSGGWVSWVVGVEGGESFALRGWYLRLLSQWRSRGSRRGMVEYLKVPLSSLIWSGSCL